MIVFAATTTRAHGRRASRTLRGEIASGMGRRCRAIRARLFESARVRTHLC
jgi:hypothetical protein